MYIISFFRQFIPNISHLFAPVKKAIAESFLSIIFNKQVSDTVQTLASTPIKCARVAIHKPCPDQSS